jgi:hypothetical protein
MISRSLASFLSLFSFSFFYLILLTCYCYKKHRALVSNQHFFKEMVQIKNRHFTNGKLDQRYRGIVLFCMLPEGVKLLEDVDDLGQVGDALSHGEGQREERQLLQHSQLQHLHSYCYRVFNHVGVTSCSREKPTY